MPLLLDLITVSNVSRTRANFGPPVTAFTTPFFADVPAPSEQPPLGAIPPEEWPFAVAAITEALTSPTAEVTVSRRTLRCRQLPTERAGPQTAARRFECVESASHDRATVGAVTVLGDGLRPRRALEPACQLGCREGTAEVVALG